MKWATMLFPNRTTDVTGWIFPAYGIFNLTPMSVGEAEGWFAGLKAPRTIAVPAS
ncbi:MAG: hypothetical protein R2867_26020 [Caldilineaceae bacterium]